MIDIETEIKTRAVRVSREELSRYRQELKSAGAGSNNYEEFKDKVFSFMKEKLDARLAELKDDPHPQAAELSDYLKKLKESAFRQNQENKG